MIAIVAVDKCWGIGQGGEQLIYIPEDLKRFKNFTTGNTIILGRKTMYTFPGSKPLKNRRNLILSRDPHFRPEGAEVFPDIPTLMEQVTDPDNTYVVGGAMVYNTMIDQCDRAYITKIDAQYPADCWFPNLDDDPNWEVESEGEWLEHEGVRFRYVNYRRK